MVEDDIRITLVRHGQTEANLTKRWQGQHDSPLTALGVRQAQLLGERMAQRSFTCVVSSDLSRALDTARAIGVPVRSEPAFREFDVGSWEGLTEQEVAARYPGELERLRQGEDMPLGGGESYGSFSARIDGALGALRAELRPGDHALVVCHGGVIGSVLSGVFGSRKNRSWSTARPANTSITELSFNAAGPLLHVFNDTLHLLPLGAWPVHADFKGSVALLCDVAEPARFGEFAAHYQPDAPGVEGGDLAQQLRALVGRHPEQRVSLGAAAERIQGWAEATVLGTSSEAGKVSLPPPGSVCHAGLHAERLFLLDYGVSC